MIYPFEVKQYQNGNHIFWVAKSTVLDHLVGQGDTAVEAVEELEENEEALVSYLEDHKETLPAIFGDLPAIPVEEL